MEILNIVSIGIGVATREIAVAPSHVPGAKIKARCALEHVGPNAVVIQKQYMKRR